MPMWPFLLSTGVGAAPATVTPTPVAPPVSCPTSMAALALPGWIDAADGRLQSKHLVVVLKGARRVFRSQGGRLLRVDGMAACWPMGLGPTPIGHKYSEGDGKTPQGWYRSSDKPWSSFYGAIAVHYPNADDAKAALADGRINAATASQITQALTTHKKPPQTTPLGGEILIHGGGAASDWTLGCIAMDNPDLDQLRASLPADQVTDVLVLP